ncbi:MAG: tetraacyldisaccharide 4'-kinase, partial [Verrucomicrobiota bacterium]
MRERWQKFTEAAETYLLAVILEDLPGRKASLIRALLSVLAHLFAGIVKLRRLLYSVRILRDSTLGVQVIAVGNLTVGGTGKTPV